jgi:hypothetical protein
MMVYSTCGVSVFQVFGLCGVSVFRCSGGMVCWYSRCSGCAVCQYSGVRVVQYVSIQVFGWHGMSVSMGVRYGTVTV